MYQVVAARRMQWDPSWLKLVHTLGRTQGAQGRYDTHCADEERLTCAFAFLSLTLAVHPGVGTTQLPTRISARIHPWQLANPQVSALQDH